VVVRARISLDKLGDGHGVANQLTDLEKRATARGWTVTHRLSDNDIGVTRKDPTAAGKYRPGYEEVLRLVDARAAASGGAGAAAARGGHTGFPAAAGAAEPAARRDGQRRAGPAGIALLDPRRSRRSDAVG
jgi:hypothetical protein